MPTLRAQRVQPDAGAATAIPGATMPFRMQASTAAAVLPLSALLPRAPASGSAWGPGLTRPAPAAAAAPDLAPGDAGFIALCQAYRASGGIARGDDLAHWMAGRGQGNSLHLAALIVGRDAFSFQWRDSFWVPMFQFSPLQPAWGDGARQVLGELGTVLDGWSLAAWFVQGNSCLSGQRPLDLLADHLPAVLAAARTDRYVIKG
jgi:hypothetical protein